MILDQYGNPMNRKPGLLMPSPRHVCAMSANLGLGLGFSAGTGAPASGGGAGDPPGSPTLWMKLDDESAGAFGTPANAGSVSANFARNSTTITVEAGGPNGLKYAHNTNTTDYIELTGKVWSDLITAAVGTIACIFRMTGIGDTNGDTQPWGGEGPFFDSTDYFGMGADNGTDSANRTVHPFVRGGSENSVTSHAYAENTWRAIVMRWDATTANKLYSKMDGDSNWTETAHNQNIFSIAGGVRICLSNSVRLATLDATDVMAYTTESEEDGDSLLSWLVSRAGL